MNPPTHVAIIMDGNGRWGMNRKNSRNYGHKVGVQVVNDIIGEAIHHKIKYLTLYTFSTDNWKRPKKEISFLIKLLENYIHKELENLIKKKIKVKIIGNIKRFPNSLKLKLIQTEKLTKYNGKIQINIALNYGSKEEIVSTIKKLYKKSLPINKKNIGNNLYTANIPDPEILIRTGNRKRLSNFLLWQLSYTEIYFEKKLWPDFTNKDFKRIILKFSNVKRNFGGIK